MRSSEVLVNVLFLGSGQTIKSAQNAGATEVCEDLDLWGVAESFKNFESLEDFENKLTDQDESLVNQNPA